MSVFDDALKAWNESQSVNDPMKADAAFDYFFGEKPEMIGNGIPVNGARLTFWGENRWRLIGTCPVCGQRFSDEFSTSRNRAAALITLGKSIYQWQFWVAQHDCVSKVDYGMLDRSLEYAAGKTESGSACEAELALGLVIAQALVAIAKELNKREDW